MSIDGEIIDDVVGDGTPRYLPDAATIREVCRQIQAEWSPAEELRRRAVQPSQEMYLGGVVHIGD